MWLGGKSRARGESSVDSSRAFRKGNPDPSLPWNFSLALPRNQLPWNSHLAQSARVLIYPTENPSSLSRVGSFFRLCLGSERLEMLPRAPRSSGELGQGSPSAPAPLPSSAEPTNGEKKSGKKKGGKGKTRDSSEGRGGELGLEQTDVLGRVTSVREHPGGASSPPEGTRKVFGRNLVSLLGIPQETEGSPYCRQEKEANFPFKSLLNAAAPVSKVPQRNPTALRAGLFFSFIFYIYFL